ncbi:uroporphyrinogen-III synthase [Acidicapsa dinghuensis]|uniref:Uroporphyrinogen-III synthase n=1 Tax=Acidicapsa dinghuensis TaxID=2218256 RepID=A0ABW1ELZ5_9BACT|nr:uroporphyrinogen-III synthase [Acidicapsa dinghuensis]
MSDSANASGSEGLPLSGKRVLVTRAAHQAGKLSEGLRALGAEPVEVPVLEMLPPESYEPLDDALRQLDSFDWLILTSGNAVDAVAARCSHLQVKMDGPRVAAVGRATAEAARKAGFRVAVVPESYHSEGLVAALGDAAKGTRVLLARAAVARDVIPEALAAGGANITVVDAYRTVIPESAAERLREAMLGRIDVAAFTSSSSVKHLAALTREAGIAFPLAGVKAVSIGPVTSGTLRELGWQPAAEAAVSDVAGLLDAVAQGIRNRQ